MAHIGKHVKLNDPAYVHETAYIYGKVTLNKDVSIWPYVVMRAEMNEIVIGERTNIQDFVMAHVGGVTPTIVGRNCSITHHVTLHGCTIGDNCLIGINATIMDGAVIGNNCIVAGHSMGGMIAGEMAALAPNDVRGLALIAAAGLWLDDHPIPDLFAKLPYEMPELLFNDVELGTRLITQGFDFGHSEDELMSIVKPGDIVIALGAGDINQAVRDLHARLQAQAKGAAPP